MRTLSITAMLKLHPLFIFKYNYVGSKTIFSPVYLFTDLNFLHLPDLLLSNTYTSAGTMSCELLIDMFRSLKSSFKIS